MNKMVKRKIQDLSFCILILFVLFILVIICTFFNIYIFIVCFLIFGIILTLISAKLSESSISPKSKKGDTKR